ncbi:maleylpyruvate isomerase family mycothiol-dependent enzyme [Nocardioides speluncae]|uniref:maleylpyruvate isomerase family mycothiol-dependent enzyme n=1 Tax=Nocardioides speluncae TaxID=2670337 RepID=UPI000D69F3E0|nr:maleylpyruvate isomerase family mycothiol-dependent enzyme [Nocardioides speluncae]
MATDLTVSEHLDGLREALLAFVRYADRAGSTATVPTCPDWTVHQLIAHQGMVHRWARATLLGEEVDPDAIERDGLAASDPIDWLRAGAAELIKTLVDTPDDAGALVFLNDAPPARAFWCRRQCHETTIHAVDALSAALGRYPSAADTWITREVALDGIDELLAGFLTRRKSRVRSEEPMSVAVLPTDASHSWLVEISDQPPVTTRRDHQERAEVNLVGPAVSLYLALWNRSNGADLDESGDLLDRWRSLATITWS